MFSLIHRHHPIGLPWPLFVPVPRADIVFVVKTKPHDRFERDGNDLNYTAEITLDQALTGFAVHVEALDGRKLTVKEPSGIPSSAHRSVVRSEGMPSQRDRNTKGNLIVR